MLLVVMDLEKQKRMMSKNDSSLSIGIRIDQTGRKTCLI